MMKPRYMYFEHRISITNNFPRKVSVSMYGLTSHSIHNTHFGNESFQTINCTGTDKQKQNTVYILNTKEKQKKQPQLTEQSTP